MRRQIRMRTLPESGFGSDFLDMLLLGAAFLLGGVAGLLVACTGTRGSGAAIYLEEYFSSISTADSLKVSALSVLLDVLRWPALLVSLSAAGRIGLLATPALLFFRGFLLTHAITVFAVSFGVDGLFLSAAVFGVSAVFTVPLMYAISCDTLRRHGASGWVFQGRALFLLFCTICICVAAILQGSVMPTVVSALCRQLFL